MSRTDRTVKQDTRKEQDGEDVVLGQCQACLIQVGPNFIETDLYPAEFKYRVNEEHRTHHHKGKLCGRCILLHNLGRVFIVPKSTDDGRRKNG